MYFDIACFLIAGSIALVMLGMLPVLVKKREWFLGGGLLVLGTIYAFQEITTGISYLNQPNPAFDAPWYWLLVGGIIVGALYVFVTAVRLYQTLPKASPPTTERDAKLD
jgi:hypothetical protein